MDELAILYSLIKRFEGCRLTPYYCPAGVLTCGWGSTGPDVFPGRTWTQEYADARLETDALKFARGTKALCPSLTGDALCAISDFSYNLGLGRLKASTLRRKLNAGDFSGSVSELKKWVRGGGRVLTGLVRRRAAEALLLPINGTQAENNYSGGQQQTPGQSTDPVVQPENREQPSEQVSNWREFINQIRKHFKFLQ